MIREAMTFSIVVPVYNAEKTLRRCIDSVVKQKGLNYELILVNDGSTDESGDICKAFTEKYQQVQYILKENGGVSSARNAGIEQARGEYILFLDSDDYFAEDYFLIIDELCRKQPDLVLCGVQAFGGRERCWSVGNCIETLENNISEIVASAMRKYLFSSVCAKVFKTSIIAENGLRFDQNLKIGEDQLFLFTYTMHIHSLASTEKVGYFVDTSGEGSLSRKRRNYLVSQLVEVNRKMYEVYGSVEHSPQASKNYKAALSWMVYRSAYSCCKELQKFEYTPEQRRQEIKRICRLFCDEEIKPIGFKCRLISIPIRYHFAWLIDKMSEIATKR